MARKGRENGEQDWRRVEKMVSKRGENGEQEWRKW